MNINVLHIILIVFSSLVIVKELTKNDRAQVRQEQQSSREVMSEAADAADAAALAAVEAELAEIKKTKEDAAEERSWTEKEIAEAIENNRPANTVSKATRSGIDTKIVELKFSPVKEEVEFSGMGVKSYHCQGEEIRIMHDDIHFTVTGQCHSVTVSAPNANVSIQKTQILNVYGPEARVSVEAVDQIEAIGPESVVSYRRGLTQAEPNISDRGFGKVVKK